MLCPCSIFGKRTHWHQCVALFQNMYNMVLPYLWKYIILRTFYILSFKGMPCSLVCKNTSFCASYHFSSKTGSESNLLKKCHQLVSILYLWHDIMYRTYSTNIYARSTIDNESRNKLMYTDDCQVTTHLLFCTIFHLQVDIILHILLVSSCLAKQIKCMLIMHVTKAYTAYLTVRLQKNPKNASYA